MKIESNTPPVRLFIETSESSAKKAADIFTEVLEEDGYPIAFFETNEDSGIWAVSIYCDASAEAELQTRLTKALEVSETSCNMVDQVTGQINWQVEQLGNVDWVTETLKGLAPIRAGRFIVHGSHDSHIPNSHDKAICIDAGQAFGTGHHATTAGCLELLTKAMRRRRYFNILDLGTGSGVLAIAAAKLQPTQILATDIDPIATQVAKQNVKINGSSARIRCATANGMNHRIFAETRSFDLILANILARPLEKLAPEICRHLAPGGTVILSGLLKHQKPRVLNAYLQHGLALREQAESENWLAIMVS